MAGGRRASSTDHSIVLPSTRLRETHTHPWCARARKKLNSIHIASQPFLSFFFYFSFYSATFLSSLLLLFKSLSYILTFFLFFCHAFNFLFFLFFFFCSFYFLLFLIFLSLLYSLILSFAFTHSLTLVRFKSKAMG